MQLFGNSHLKGTVMEITRQNASAAVALNVGAGNVINITVSSAELEALGLEVGSTAYAAVGSVILTTEG
ncbi:MAG: TOBE domain-containing protein [Oscillospiraceae bacterium]|nr:TOBE domain-containing protein [Oscillospiraceae bacterium]